MQVDRDGRPARAVRGPVVAHETTPVPSEPHHVAAGELRRPRDRVEHALDERSGHELGAVLGLGSHEQLRDHSVDRRPAQVEQPADLVVRAPGGDELEDIELTRR